MRKIIEIESLRGYLAWWVVIGHIFHLSGFYADKTNAVSIFIGYGTYAVDVFIIISGFVIFFLLENKPENYTPYITRRIFRIFPLFIFSVIIGFLLQDMRIENLFLSQEWMPEKVFKKFYESWIIHKENQWTYLPIVLTGLHGTLPDEIFPFIATSFNGPIWSISLELQFYLLAPFIFPLFKTTKKTLTISIIVLLLYTLRKNTINASMGAFLTYHIDFFYIGWISYIIYKWQSSQKFIPKTSILNIVLVIFALTYNQEIKDFVTGSPNFRLDYKFPLFAWAVFLSYIIDKQAENKSPFSSAFDYLLANKIAVKLGSISYSTYLTHIPIIIIVQNTIYKTTEISNARDAFVYNTLISVPLIIGVSFATHHLIEVPGIKLGSKVAKYFKRKQLSQPI